MVIDSASSKRWIHDIRTYSSHGRAEHSLNLAIPNVNRFLDFNNIDEVKALLNSTAADCLQSSRFNPEGEAQQIDSNILSDSKLASIGYKINTSAKDCSYLEILPTDSDDTLRFPIGFSITRGKVTKFATPTSGDKGSINSCEGWAGGNCKQNEELKALVNYNKQISDAKQKCENSYSDWLKSDGNGPVNRWNPSADSKCPSRPEGCEFDVHHKRLQQSGIRPRWSSSWNY